MQAQDSTIEKLNGFTIEYRLAPNMVIFSHGFGVKRDSRGMFSDVVTGLPIDTGYLLLDYNKAEGDVLRLSGISDQVAQLQAVIAWLWGHPVVKRLAIVAHSKGCTVAALARPEHMASVVMFAPPLHVGSSIRTRFVTRPGAHRDGDAWVVPRTDGTWSKIDDAVLNELDTVDGEAAVLSYAQTQPIHFVVAGKDNVLVNQDYSHVAASPGATLRTIDDADHDFSGPSRSAFVRMALDYLGADLAS